MQHNQPPVQIVLSVGIKRLEMGLRLCFRVELWTSCLLYTFISWHFNKQRNSFALSFQKFSVHSILQNKSNTFLPHPGNHPATDPVSHPKRPESLLASLDVLLVWVYRSKCTDVNRRMTRFGRAWSRAARIKKRRCEMWSPRDFEFSGVVC